MIGTVAGFWGVACAGVIGPGATAPDHLPQSTHTVAEATAPEGAATADAPPVETSTNGCDAAFASLSDSALGGPRLTSCEAHGPDGFLVAAVLSFPAQDRGGLIDLRFGSFDPPGVPIGRDHLPWQAHLPFGLRELAHRASNRSLLLSSTELDGAPFVRVDLVVDRDPEEDQSEHLVLTALYLLDPQDGPSLVWAGPTDHHIGEEASCSRRLVVDPEVTDEVIQLRVTTGSCARPGPARTRFIRSRP